MRCPAAIRYIEEDSADVFKVSHISDNLLLTSIEVAVLLLMAACRYTTQHSKPKEKFSARSFHAAAWRALRALHVVFAEVRDASNQNMMERLVRTCS